MDMEVARPLQRGRRRLLAGLLLMAVVLVGVAGFLLPARMVIPVVGATPNDWNPESFWYYPWGASGVHKGIDIFADQDTPLVAAADGVVLYSGTLSRGGKVVVLLGAKWRLHYFAHLARIDVGIGDFVAAGERIGAVGDSGNARGKPPHVHYSIRRLIPDPRQWTDQPQGWRRMFFLDPGALLTR